MSLNKRKCKQCKEVFQKVTPLQFVCSPKCSIDYAKLQTKKKQDKKIKEINKDVRERKEKLKTTSDYLKEVQVVFNKWIRLRDKGLNCISCNKPAKKENAGHYRSVGSCPELRFEPLNVHLQCEYCNTYQHGNLIPYRQNLIKKIGISSVEWLESNHEPKHYSKVELIGMKTIYKDKIKEL